MPLPKEDNEWNNLHNDLKEVLQKEVNIMRELLANMHQEEVSLLLNDQGSLHELLQQRSVIVDRLSFLRSNRIATTTKLEQFVSKDSTPAPECILPFEDEMSTEIFSLRDQLMALTEQMNRQQSQNKYLTEHPEHIRASAAQNAPRAKRKASVATYQIKK
jgi:flagellar biosynthesis/type III secretory pathway chaperone